MGVGVTGCNNSPHSSDRFEFVVMSSESSPFFSQSVRKALITTSTKWCAYRTPARVDVILVFQIRVAWSKFGGACRNGHPSHPKMRARSLSSGSPIREFLNTNRPTKARLRTMGALLRWFSGSILAVVYTNLHILPLNPPRFSMIHLRRSRSNKTTTRNTPHKTPHETMEVYGCTPPPFSLVLEWIDQLWAAEREREADKEEKVLSDLDLPLSPPIPASFMLLEPLRIHQRKSYRGESRFLSPKPVIALNRASPLSGRLSKCAVTVKLLDDDGSPLDVEEQDCLSSPNGQETILLPDYLRTPPIPLMLTGSIEGKSLRLGFSIQYETLEGERHKIFLTSNVFQMIRERRQKRKRSSVG
ncbi:hypothetical protein PROFUN_06901 [Planoprotostelium fungivorum]|uniref:Uncharacterized protein n=1 Tax=Planoprotostelium fungivorum TaxID=1890364 RepID=A0A2P6NMY5_9EUKA|nr:hypothetical protein PROFUN_06901 [Planoprotostelium fungivorum]